MREGFYSPEGFPLPNMELAEAPHGLRPHRCKNSFIHKRPDQSLHPQRQSPLDPGTTPAHSYFTASSHLYRLLKRTTGGSDSTDGADNAGNNDAGDAVSGQQWRPRLKPGRRRTLPYTTAAERCALYNAQGAPTSGGWRSSSPTPPCRPRDAPCSRAAPRGVGPSRSHTCGWPRRTRCFCARQALSPLQLGAPRVLTDRLLPLNKLRKELARLEALEVAARR